MSLSSLITKDDKLRPLLEKMLKYHKFEQLVRSQLPFCISCIHMDKTANVELISRHIYVPEQDDSKMVLHIIFELFNLRSTNLFNRMDIAALNKNIVDLDQYIACIEYIEYQNLKKTNTIIDLMIHINRSAFHIYDWNTHYKLQSNNDAYDHTKPHIDKYKNTYPNAVYYGYPFSTKYLSNLIQYIRKT